MTSTGVHALPGEFDAVAGLARNLGTSRSRVWRAAIALAGTVEQERLRAVITAVEPPHGKGLQSGVFLSAAELGALDQLANAAGTSRSRLARAALRLALRDADATRRLVRGLPADRRLRQPED